MPTERRRPSEKRTAKKPRSSRLRRRVDPNSPAVRFIGWVRIIVEHRKAGQKAGTDIEIDRVLAKQTTTILKTFIQGKRTKKVKEELAKEINRILSTAKINPGVIQEALRKAVIRTELLRRKFPESPEVQKFIEDLAFFSKHPAQFLKTLGQVQEWIKEQKRQKK